MVVYILCIYVQRQRTPLLIYAAQLVAFHRFLIGELLAYYTMQLAMLYLTALYILSFAIMMTIKQIKKATTVEKVSTAAAK